MPSLSPTPRFMAPLKRHTIARSPLAETTARTHTPPRSRAAAGVGAAAASPIVPSRSYPTESIEARLLALVHHFNVYQGGSKWTAQLAQLMRHHARDRFLSASDAQLIATVREKAHALMRNIEALMTEATLDGVAVDSGALRTVSQTWDAAESLLHQVDRALQTARVETKSEQHADGRCGPSRGHSPCATAVRVLPQTPLHAIQLAHRDKPLRSTTPPSRGVVRGGSSGATMTMTTPMRGPTTPPLEEGNMVSGIASPLPQSVRPAPSTPPWSGGTQSPFGTSVHRCSSTAPLTPTSAAAAHRGLSSRATEELPLHTRKELLEVIESIGLDVVAIGSMRDADCSEAKRCFIALYGVADGHRRFQRWCDDQTLKAMRRR